MVIQVRSKEASFLTNAQQYIPLKIQCSGQARSCVLVATVEIFLVGLRGPVMQTLPDGTYQTGNVKSYISSSGSVAFTYWETAAHGAWDRAQHDE